MGTVKPIEAIQRGTNASLLATAARLYPLDGEVLDLTPGDELGFWKEIQPERLFALVAGDFRDTSTGLVRLNGSRAAGAPPRLGAWNHITFDPPYVTKGGHKTSTIHGMNARYGMLHVEKNPPLQWARQIVPGVRHAVDLLAPGGLLWWKAMDYVTGGKVHWFTKMALPVLDELGMRLEDEFILHGHPGPQPGERTRKCGRCKGTGWVYDDPKCNARCTDCSQSGCPDCSPPGGPGTGRVPSTQQHSRKSHSVLLIARKPKGRRRG